MKFWSVGPATGVWCLASGRAVNPSWRLGRGESWQSVPTPTPHSADNTVGQQSIGPLYLLVFQLVFHFVLKSNASIVLNETLAVLEFIF